MKKYLMFIVLTFVAIFAIACGNGENGNIKDENEPKSVVITGQESSMEVGEELKLSAKVLPEAAVQEVIWSSSDESVIQIVDQDGTIKAVGAGVAQITATSKAKSNVMKRIAISVTEPIVYDDPESVTITSKRAEVPIGVFITLTAEVHPLTARQDVVWSSSDESIATVNSAGRVTGISIGFVTITATVVADISLTYDFQLSVVKEQDISKTEPTEIIITGENELFEGSSIFLTADVLPHGASLTVFWSSSDENIATINNNGKLTALKQGKVFITATSAQDTTVVKSIMVTVKLLPHNEPPQNLNGYTIKLLASPGHEHEHDPFLQDYIGEDKQAKQRAWQEVEDLYNTKIVVDKFPDTAPWGGPRIAWVNQNAATNSNVADIMVLTTQWISELVNGNSVVDVSEYYEMYGMKQMPAAMRQASTYKGGIYALLRNTTGSVFTDYGMFYNVNLVESLDLDSPAKIFNDGDWTYTRFLEYVADAHSVMREDQSVLSGKASLYWMGMTNAAGVKLLDTITLSVNFNNQYARLAASTLREAYNTAGWGTNAYDSDVTSFNEGKSLFQAAEMWFIRSNDRWSGDLWGEGTTKFGYVPYPRPDLVDIQDTRVPGGDGECYMMIRGVEGRPSSIHDAHIYRVWSEVMLRTAKYMQEDPSYNEELSMKRVAEYRLDDPESLEAVTFFKRDKLIFDPFMYGVVNYTYISPFIDNIVMEGQDYTEVMDTHINHYREALESLYG